MKRKNIPQISLFLLILATACVAYSAGKEPEVSQGGAAVSETIPPSARFDLKDIADDRYVLVGRLSMGRKFLGTSATPPYHDFAQFHCFNGDELKFSTFTEPELESRLMKRLVKGRSLPVMLTVRFERIRVGHDGLNMSERLIAQIEECKAATAEAICAAAEAAGFEAADSERFKSTLDPDLERDGVAVSLGDVWVRSKTTSRGSALAIRGIRVFNTTPEVATIEIIGLKFEQGGESQRCDWSERMRTPRRWQVEAGGWSDGNYEDGKMPGVLWMFDPSGPIEPRKEVKVQLELKLNESEPLILTRTVDPI